MSSTPHTGMDAGTWESPPPPVVPDPGTLDLFAGDVTEQDGTPTDDADNSRQDGAA